MFVTKQKQYCWEILVRLKVEQTLAWFMNITFHCDLLIKIKNNAIVFPVSWKTYKYGNILRFNNYSYYSSPWTAHIKYSMD